MNQTKKISIAAILSALTVVFMYLGAMIQVLDLSCVALASVLVLFAHIELGTPYNWLVYGVSGVLSLILMVGVNPVIPVMYLTYCGMYPILKAYIEKGRGKKSAYLLKGLYFAAVCALLLAGAYLFSRFVMGIDFFEGALSSFTFILLPAIYVIAVAVSFVYDALLSQLVVIYMLRIRPKIARILK